MHEILMKEAKPITNISNYRHRIVREAIEIKKHSNNINREDGYRLSKLWDVLFVKTVTHPTSDQGQSCLSQRDISLADPTTNHRSGSPGLAAAE